MCKMLLEIQKGKKYLPQSSSSERSPQSFLPSHFAPMGTQYPDLHMKSVLLHSGTREKNLFVYMYICVYVIR